MRYKRHILFAVLALSASMAPLVAAIETPDDLEVKDELPGPLGVYYSYSGNEAAFINVRIVNNRFEAYFLEADRKTIVEPEWPQAIIHYGNAVRKGLNRNTTVMRQVEGPPLLRAARFIPPPDRYWIRLILQNKADEEATDNYNEAAPEDAHSLAFDMEILNQLTTQDSGEGDPAGGTTTY